MQSFNGEDGRFIGMDEAGYGPNLGPLVLGVTTWCTPGSPEAFDFYQALAPIVSRNGSRQGKSLHLADSKMVNVGKQGFASLERSALALLQVCGTEAKSFHQLWNVLAGESLLPNLTFAPWYHADLELPVRADADQICQLAGELKERMLAIGLKLVNVGGEIVVESRFNALSLAEGSNKALALSRLAFALLHRSWECEVAGPTLFVGDKHGGRNRYDDLLAEILDGQFITRVEESLSISRYRVQQTELRFQMRGEQHLPVACASIIAKYVRELAMDQLNSFWLGHCPGLKPTRGYPMDARRFRDDVSNMLPQLAISDRDFWRER